VSPGASVDFCRRENHDVISEYQEGTSKYCPAFNDKTGTGILISFNIYAKERTNTPWYKNNFLKGNTMNCIILQLMQIF